MITKIWIPTESVFSWVLSNRNDKPNNNCLCDGQCFEKTIGYNVTDLLHLYVTCPMAIVQYPNGLDFVRNPRKVS